MSAVTSALLASAPQKILYYRHRLPVRIFHWVNVLSLTVLLLSGLGIFNAHPALYWGLSSYTGRPAVLEITSKTQAHPPAAAGNTSGSASTVSEDRTGEKRGVLRVAGHEFDTTGILGISTSANGELNEHAFPSWLTIPGNYSLSESRLWHFFFAWLLFINGFCYLVYALASGHLRRDLAPDTQDIRGIGRSIVDHLKFKHPTGDAARRYNVLQKFAYLVVIFVLLPLVILMGLAMSPMVNSVLPGWVDWFGGRQSARTIHFIVAWLLVAFVVIHVFEVVISGFWNHLRSMITGYFAADAPSTKGDHHESK
jgi:thiosulfate reductase cytochrome b subunit